MQQGPGSGGPVRAGHRSWQGYARQRCLQWRGSCSKRAARRGSASSSAGGSRCSLASRSFGCGFCRNTHGGHRSAVCGTADTSVWTCPTDYSPFTEAGHGLDRGTASDCRGPSASLRCPSAHSTRSSRYRADGRYTAARTRHCYCVHALGGTCAVLAGLPPQLERCWKLRARATGWPSCSYAGTSAVPIDFGSEASH